MFWREINKCLRADEVNEGTIIPIFVDTAHETMAYFFSASHQISNFKADFDPYGEMISIGSTMKQPPRCTIYFITLRGGK